MPLSNNDIMLALLATDSYNRGYGQGIAGLGGQGSRLGGATIIDESDIESGSDGVDAGFYAIAYDWNGQTVISYRGTDGFLTDGPNGYGIGLGVPGGPQAKLAVEFYKQVLAGRLGTTAEALTGEQMRDSGIIVTGHSLGAGLAANDNHPPQALAA